MDVSMADRVKHLQLRKRRRTESGGTLVLDPKFWNRHFLTLSGRILGVKGRQS